MDATDTTDPTTQPLVLLPRTQDAEFETLSGNDLDYTYWSPNAYPPPTLVRASGETTSHSYVSRSSGVGTEDPAPRAKPRLERKSHTKSRRGCFNCKRRRIKCSEALPACGYCVKRGFTCEYPPSPTIVHQPHDRIPLFSMQDMRCFQHFMLRCYPHHPLGNEDIWTHEVPCLSRSHEHLMHSILGLAASDLAGTDPTLLTTALTHRLKAIEAIKKTLPDTPGTSSLTHESANALLATCLALTIQSVFLGDGMVEYMTFIRGMMVVGLHMWKGRLRPMFANLVGDEAQTALEPHMVNLPLIREAWVDAAVRGIEGLEVLCGAPVEREYHSILLDWARTLYVSSWEAYRALEKHYMWWVLLPHASFQTIIDPASQTATLLASHWIALQQTMVSVTTAHTQLRKKEPQGGGLEKGLTGWLRYLNTRLDAQHAAFNRWPIWVQGQLEMDPYFFDKPR